MADLFDEQCDEAAARGGRALVSLWTSTLWDLLESVILVRTRWWGRVRDAFGDLSRDVALAGRQLERRPGAVLLAVLTLGLGIGTATTVFSVVEVVALRPPPVPEADDVVVLQRLLPAGGQTLLSESDYVRVAERQEVFSEFAAMLGASYTLRQRGQRPLLVAARQVTHTMTPLLGAEIVLGRSFLASDERPADAPTMIMLSETLWRERFEASPDIVGDVLTLDRHDVEVVGVVADNDVLGRPGLLTAMAPSLTAPRTRRYLTVMGRRAPGVGDSAVGEALTSFAEELGNADPEANGGWGLSTVPLAVWLFGDGTKRLGLLLLATAALLLLMACVSVSNLLMVRAAERESEVSVRTAMGASRSRISRQLLTESMALGGLGGVVGVLFSGTVLPLVRRLGGDAVPRLMEAQLDARLLLVAVGMSTLTVLLFGVLPTLWALRPGLVGVLTRRPGGSRPWSRMRDGLVVFQTALSVLILVGAGLMLRSFEKLRGQDVGFEPSHLISSMLPTPAGTKAASEVWTFAEAYEERLRKIDGVSGVGSTISAPFSGYSPRAWLRPRPTPGGDTVPVQALSWRAVTPGYLSVLGLLPSTGRALERVERSGEGYGMAVVVDDALARAFWPGREAVGEVLQWVGDDVYDLEVVAVVPAVRDETVDGAPRPRIYWLYGPVPLPRVYTLVDSELDPQGLWAEMERELMDLDPEVASGLAFVVEEAMSAQIAEARLTTQILSAFALVALVLAAMGIYGVTALGVRCRNGEMGIRYAMGAQQRSLVGAVMKRGVALAVFGVLLGVMGAVGVSRLLGQVLYETGARDPVAFGAVMLLVVGVAVLASWIPAYRVSRLDPLRALGSD